MYRVFSNPPKIQTILIVLGACVEILGRVFRFDRFYPGAESLGYPIGQTRKPSGRGFEFVVVYAPSFNASDGGSGVYAEHPAPRKVRLDQLAECFCIAFPDMERIPWLLMV